MSFNNLDAGQAERLALLLEELGEAQQAIGKILRHGYESAHPDGGPTNREALERELGDVAAAIEMLVTERDIEPERIHEAQRVKRKRVRQYLHHQPEQP